MFIKKNEGRRCILMMITVPTLLAGCGTTPINPADLKRPVALTCIEVPQGMEAHELLGLGKYHWTTRLAPGPYIAEREDADGTYYRAPPGGVYQARDDLANLPPSPLVPRVRDGGIWMPHTQGNLPHVYTYYSTQEAPVVALPEKASCATAVSLSDPKSKGVNTVAFATGGALGGATGGAVATAVTRNTSASSGQAVGAGAAGGAIAGLLVAAMIDMDVGKIFHHPVSNDPKFMAALQELSHSAAPIPAAPTLAPDEK